jgi:hypothetical protein
MVAPASMAANVFRHAKPPRIVAVKDDAAPWC